MRKGCFKRVWRAWQAPVRERYAQARVKERVAVLKRGQPKAANGRGQKRGKGRTA